MKLKHSAYKEDSLKQLDFVQHESATQKTARLKKKNLRWLSGKRFRSSFYYGAENIKPLLPSFNLLTDKMDPKHKKIVSDAVRKRINRYTFI